MPPGFRALPQLYIASFEAKMALLGSIVAGVLLNITQVRPGRSDNLDKTCGGSMIFRVFVSDFLWKSMGSTWCFNFRLKGASQPPLKRWHTLFFRQSIKMWAITAWITASGGYYYLLRNSRTNGLRAFQALTASQRMDKTNCSWSVWRLENFLLYGWILTTHILVCTLYLLVIPYPLSMNQCHWFAIWMHIIYSISVIATSLPHCDVTGKMLRRDYRHSKKNLHWFMWVHSLSRLIHYMKFLGTLRSNMKHGLLEKFYMFFPLKPPFFVWGVPSRPSCLKTGLSSQGTGSFDVPGLGISLGPAHFNKRAVLMTESPSVEVIISLYL